MTGFGSSCGACKFLRRKCTSDCVFSPYFSYDEATTHFSAVHKVYGASNVANLQEEINILASSLIMANSTVGVLNCGSVQAPMKSNNEIHYILQNDANRAQYCQNQLADVLSHEGSSATIYHQSCDSIVNIELSNAHGLQDSSLFGDSNSNPLEKFLSGIDQEVFMNHPWFKHNADMN
ncbi:unnamed protein product [Lupinus luteus]|uniref:LOB domain-containing protein n=1 Tax=Lupinus luteus TaxID=3873 RepID=A0AAV1X205_LUPLU